MPIVAAVIATPAGMPDKVLFLLIGFSDVYVCSDSLGDRLSGSRDQNSIKKTITVANVPIISKIRHFRFLARQLLGLYGLAILPVLFAELVNNDLIIKISNVGFKYVRC